MFEKSKILEFVKGFINFWNILRFILIVICFVWFCYNAVQIVSKFMEYNTIVMVEYKQPNETDLPAFTICASSFIYDEDLEQDYWEDYSNWDNLTTNEKYKKRLEIKDKAFQSMTADDILKRKSVTFKSLVDQCNFYPYNKYKNGPGIPCDNPSQIVESINQGKKCFTIFSQMNITKTKTAMKMEYEMNPYIEIILANNSESDIAYNLFRETSIFTVHSPNIIPTGLDYKYYMIYKDVENSRYDIRFTKQISHLKRPPYKTMCKDYSIEDPPGQKSRGDCLNRCIADNTFVINENCFNFYSVITNDMVSKGKKEGAKICVESKSDYLIYATARRKCMEDCQMSCMEQYVEISYADYYTNIKNNNLISIRSDTTPYTIVYHEESMGEPELIGNLGGHAHIWLGLSALKIFNFFVHLFNRLKRVFFK